ncbi:MAG: hypothetical protein Q9216_003824 [Gyalolechia sp. 2 TL-2023]
MEPQDQTSSLKDLDINKWRQDVAATIRHRRPCLPQALNSSSRILRSGRSSIRPGLGEISGNRQRANPNTKSTNYSARAGASTRKQKRNMASNRSGKHKKQDPDENLAPEPSRGKPRGRPPLDPYNLSARGTSHKVALNDQVEAQSAFKSITVSRSRSRSRSQKTIDQPPSTTSIPLRFLENCNPAVKQRTLQQVRAQYNMIPDEANKLLRSLRDVPTGAIYESEADTPRKTKDAPLKHEFMPGDRMSYPLSDLRHLKKRIDRILDRAAWNHRKDVHEGQWGAIAHTLLEEFALWPVGETVDILNV